MNYFGAKFKKKLKIIAYDLGLIKSFQYANRGQLDDLIYLRNTQPICTGLIKNCKMTN